MQYMMEEMIPELEDFERRGIFSKPEIKAIIKRRTEFEYLLKRRATLKADFMHAIAYEEKLETLRKHRKRMLNAEAQREVKKGDGAGGKGAKVADVSAAGDHAVIRRIHFIYERALRKFRGDLTIWVDFFTFCRRHGGGKALSRALAKALALHPTMPGLWSYAAAWEFERQGNVPAARKLMQRGLRNCPQSEELWLDYFRMELLFVNKLRERRVVLGLATGEPEAGEPLPTEGAMEEGAAGGEGDGGAEGSIAAAATSAKKALAAVLGGAVAKVVYIEALRTLPDSAQLRLRFLDVLRPFGDAVSSLEREVLQSLSEGDMLTEPEAWDARARRWADEAAAPPGPLKKGETRTGRALGLYREALQAVPSAHMHLLHVAFLRDTRAWDAMCAAAAAAADAGAASEDLFVLWVEALEQQGRTQDAAAAAERAVCALPQAAPLWLLRLRTAVALTPRSGNDVLAQLLARACKSVPADAAEDLWCAVQRLLASHAVPQESVAAVLERAVAGGGGRHLARATAAAVRCAAVTGGAAAARELSDRLLRLPAPSLALLQAAIEVECAAATRPGAEGAQALERARRLFQSAVEAHGADEPGLWLGLYALEQRHGGSRAGTVQWRAMKALREPLRAAFQNGCGSAMY